jgi:hypothetical protein
MFEQIESTMQANQGIVLESISAQFLMDLYQRYSGNLVLTFNGRDFAIQKFREARADANCIIVADPETADEFGFIAGLASKLWADYRNRRNPFAGVAEARRAEGFVPRDDALIISDEASPLDRITAVVSTGDCSFIIKRNGKFVPVCEEELRNMPSVEKPLSSRTWDRINDEADQWIAAHEERMAMYEYNTTELAHEMREYLDNAWRQDSPNTSPEDISARYNGVDPECVEEDLITAAEDVAMRLFKEAKSLDVQADKLEGECKKAWQSGLRRLAKGNERTAIMKRIKAKELRAQARKWNSLPRSIEQYILERRAGGFEEQIYKNGMLIRDLTKNGWDIIFSGAEDTSDTESRYNSIVEAFESTM